MAGSTEYKITNVIQITCVILKSKEHAPEFVKWMCSAGSFAPLQAGEREGRSNLWNRLLRHREFPLGVINAKTAKVIESTSSIEKFQADILRRIFEQDMEIAGVGMTQNISQNLLAICKMLLAEINRCLSFLPLTCFAKYHYCLVLAQLNTTEIAMTDTKNTDLSLTGCAPLTVGMVLYPGFTLLDLAGPQTAFGLNGTTHLIWKTMEPVPTDMGISLNPTKTFANAPDNLDVLFVPGGFGTIDAMQDREILDYLARAGKTARYITSVCTGSVILGMAGLLDGYRAATHWGFYKPLEALGAIPSYDRVCIDRNRISGGGVTAGVDFGLTVIAEINGIRAAEITQLALEYDPQPPFTAGHPRTAKPDIVASVEAMMAHMIPPGVALATAYKEALAASAPKVATA